jgi:hypothetical protein
MIGPRAATPRTANPIASLIRLSFSRWLCSAKRPLIGSAEHNADGGIEIVAVFSLGLFCHFHPEFALHFGVGFALPVWLATPC